MAMFHDGFAAALHRVRILRGYRHGRGAAGMGRPVRGMANGVWFVRLCGYIGMLCVFSIEVLSLAVIEAVVHSSGGFIQGSFVNVNTGFDMGKG